MASGLLTLLPWLARHSLAGSLDRLRDGHVIALGAALLTLALLLALPLVFLGAVSPLLLQWLGGAQSNDQLGASLARLAGQLNAAGTLGSLTGTLGAGLLFIPWLGTTKTIALGAAILALGALGIRRSWSTRDGLLGLLVVITFIATALGSNNAAPSAKGLVLWEGESRYNHISVIESDGERQLRVNDGFAVQSFTYTDGRLPLRGVWAFYALAPSFGLLSEPRQVLLLGLGGGTTVQIYQRLFPDARVTGVELDAEIIRAGQRHLSVDLSAAKIVVQDARVFVAHEARRASGQYDVIILDAFQFPYVPFQLVTREFFVQLAGLLAPGGVVMVNVGRYSEHREVVCAVSRTLATVFDYIESADPPNLSNTILVGTRHDPALALGPARLRVSALAAKQLIELARQYAPMRPAQWPEGAPILLDDRAPVEWLTDRILWQTLWESMRGSS
jgi:spermidine synthase